jgi:CDP-diglyceride synthetase
MAKPFPIKQLKPLEMPRAGVPLVARLLTGIIGALCLVWALWAGREAAACALITAFSFLGALEFFQAAGLGRRVWLGILVGLLVLTSATFEAETFLVAYGLSLTCLWLFYPLRREDPSR